MNAAIRLARESDAAGMLDIYAPVVSDTAISFELAPPTEAEFKQRISNVLAKFPWLVCQSDTGDLVGYAYASPFRAREAYQWAAEVTVYVHPSVYRRGVGRAVYVGLLDCLRVQGYRTAVAVISLPNHPSVALHEAMGFSRVGVFHSAGFKLGQWHDVGWWYLDLAGGGAADGVAPAPPKPLSQVVGSPEFARALERAAAALGR